MAVDVVLITGNPGSGKSSLAVELAQRGFAVIDGDDLAEWQTASGRPAVQPVPTPEDWWPAHRWVWTRGGVEAAIRQHASTTRHLFVCGIATNQRDLLDLFDVIFLLTLDHQTQVERLEAPSNAARPSPERRQILDGRPIFEAQMRAVGATTIDGRQPTSLIADRILGEIAP